MEQPIFYPIGTPVEDLDTPAAVVDLDIMEQNIETLHSFFANTTAKVRPHIKVHRCPAIAHQQLQAEGNNGGICTAKIGEAEVFAQSGFSDILIANQIVTKQKLQRLASLAKTNTITVNADNLKNVQDLSDAAQEADSIINVLVEINTRLNRCGVEPGQPAVNLAKAITKAPSLNFAGVTTYEGAIKHENYEDLVTETHKYIRQVLDSKEAIEKAGIPVDTVSVGGTHNYEIAGAIEGVTEIQAASYVLMEWNYVPFRPMFKPAFKVMATITSRPAPNAATADCGHKTLGPDKGLPMTDTLPGLTITRVSAEHTKITWDENEPDKLNVGDKVWVTPHTLEICVNLFDYMFAIRKGKLEAIWEISARGRYD